MELNNLLAAEGLIIARLKATLTGVKTIASGTILAGAQDIAPYCPAVFVLPGAADPAVEAPVPSRTLERQQWQIIVCVSHIRDPLDQNTTASVAGQIMLDVCMALIGWKPDKDLRPLIYRGRGAPFFDVGYGEFPILFSTEIPLITAN